MQAKKSTVNKRKFKGTVRSSPGNKTLVVSVDTVVMHPKYLKRYKITKRYHVHDEKNQFHEGDAVNFVECRPLSKTKRWRVVYPTTI